MDEFLNKYKEQLTGKISVFDRIILKGYLPINYPQAAERFLSSQNILIKDFRTFVGNTTEQLKKHAEEFAAAAGRPYEYHRDKIRKEDYAREMAKRDGITEGLICVIARNEENHSFGLRYGKGKPKLIKNKPQSLTLYFYYQDRHLGLLHVRLSCWMPFTIQVYVNGHEWLGRQLTAKGIEYEQVENAFSWIEDCERAQRIADKLASLRWENILHVFARKVNPLLKTILKDMEYYWVIDQAEYATDVMVSSSCWLDQSYNKWQKHAAVCFQADDILRFMGRKLHAAFNSTIVTDVKKRPTVTRIKHTIRGNWIKMYNKNGIVLRVETVINKPREFRRFHLSRGKKAGYFKPMNKGIANMQAYAEVSLRSNRAYLDALAPVEDTAAESLELSALCAPVQKNALHVRALNPLSSADAALLEAVIQGQHHIHGFKACEIARLLGIDYSTDPKQRRRQSARMNRKLRLLRGHGLISKHGRSRRYRITQKGVRLINAIILLRTEAIPESMKKAA